MLIDAEANLSDADEGHWMVTGEFGLSDRSSTIEVPVRVTIDLEP